jgi:very-short-patch-repair endonuclease
VYRIGGAPQTFESRVLAAVLAGGPGAIASHRTAAALWGIDGYAKGLVEIAVPRDRWCRLASVVCHQSSDLDRVQPGVVAGIPVTPPARTLLDVGRYRNEISLRSAVESARRLKLVDWSDLIATLAAHARKGRHGVRRLRTVILANAHRAEVTDSEFELLVLALLAEHDLPRPVLHYRLHDRAGRFVAEIDLAYPSHKVALELDGKIHLREDVWERDRPRQNRIELLGWMVLRFTWRTLVETPNVIVSEVAQALANRV